MTVARRALARRAAPLIVAMAAVTALAAGCGGGDGGGDSAGNAKGAKGNSPSGAAPAGGGHPFSGTWQSEGPAAGEGATSLTVTGGGGLTFKSTVNCTGSTKRTTGRTYGFSFDCGTAKFTGTAEDPAGAKTFVMTWEEGDTSTFHLVS